MTTPDTTQSNRPKFIQRPDIDDLLAESSRFIEQFSSYEIALTVQMAGLTVEEANAAGVY